MVNDRIEMRVKILTLHAQAGADRAALADERAKLADFERNVREAEDFTGHPFERGRAIIQRHDAILRQSERKCGRREQVAALLEQIAEAKDDTEAGTLRLEVNRLVAEQTADEVYQ